MSIQRKIDVLGSIRQPSRGARVLRRARMQEIAALTLAIAFGSMGNLRPSPISPMASGVYPDGSATAPSALPKRN